MWASGTDPCVGCIASVCKDVDVIAARMHTYTLRVDLPDSTQQPLTVGHTRPRHQALSVIAIYYVEKSMASNARASSTLSQPRHQVRKHVSEESASR